MFNRPPLFQGGANIPLIMKVRTIANETLRKDFTAFEAAALIHAANYEETGATFTGVPSSNESRYNESRQIFVVVSKEDGVLTLRVDGKNKYLTARYYDDGSAPKKPRKAHTENSATATTAGTTARPETPRENQNNNEKSNNNITMSTNTNTPNTIKAATDSVQDSILALTKSVGEAEYQRGKAEAAAENETLRTEIEVLRAENETLKSKGGTGTIINVHCADGTTTTAETEKILHPKFGQILTFIKARENVYLYGPAGAGKNVICEEIAKCLGVPFFYQNTILTKFDVTGYKNAGGEFEETEFYKAWTGGGLFMLDEVDNSTAEALIALNAALANGYYTFPGVGKVPCHPEFYCVAAGNTCGLGASEEYCGRYRMDESSRDRFLFVEIDYFEEIEKQISGGDEALLEFVHALRRAAKEANVSLICGYRAIKRLAKFAPVVGHANIIDAAILRGIDTDQVKLLDSYLSSNAENPYFVAFHELVSGCK